MASDSLAAESVRSGGGFADNRDSNPLSVKGNQSTFANTDTSAATTLAPAPDAAEREAKAAWQESSDENKGPGGQKYPEGAGGQGEFPGSHNADGYSGGSTRAKQEMAQSQSGSAGGSSSSTGAGNTSGGSSAGSGGSSYGAATSGAGTSNTDSDGQSGGSRNVDAAPGYISNVVAEPTKSGKPHGKNITEGGFDDDPNHNASFTSDIGSKQDPGRRAEDDFRRLAQSASGATGPRQGKGESDKSQYDALETNQSL